MTLVATRRLCIGDVDSAGIAFTGRLVAIALEVLEQGLAAVGLDYAAMLRERRYAVPLVHLDADFQAPLRHGDPVECHLFSEALGTTSYTCRVELRAPGAAQPSASVRFKAVCIEQATFASTPLPSEIRAALARLG